VRSRMSDTLDREATPEEIEEAERQLKATAAEIVPLPKSRLAPKTSTEVLALPTLPAIQRKPSVTDATGDGQEPTAAVVLPFVIPTKPVWIGSAEATERPRDGPGGSGATSMVGSGGSAAMTTESRPPTAGPHRSRGRVTFGSRKQPPERPPEAIPNQ
jgi:hypothetical protein